MNRTKVIEATKRMCEVFDEMHLTIEERAAVAYSAYVTAIKFRTLEKSILKTKEESQKISSIQKFTAVAGTVALVLSIISLVLRLCQ